MDVSDHNLKSSSNISIASGPTRARKWKSETDLENPAKNCSPKFATFDEIIRIFTDPQRPSLANDLPVDAFILCLPMFADPIRLVSALRTRFNACVKRSGSFIGKAGFLKMRQRQVTKILEFLNDWLRSVSGMQDLRSCPKLHKALHKFLKKANHNNASLRMETLTQVLDIIATHATCDLDMGQDLVVQSKVGDKIATCEAHVRRNQMSRRSIWPSSLSPIFDCVPSDKNLARKQLERARSWRLRHYQHPSFLPMVSVHKRRPESASRNTRVAPASSMHCQEPIRNPDDDGLGRMEEDALRCLIETKSKKSTREPLAAKVAKSLTVEDIRLLGKIHPRELIGRRYKSKRKSHLAPNVLRATASFNRRVNWVITTLLAAKPGKVQTVLKFFLALADSLLQLHNFNGFMQVVNGLSSPFLRIGRWKAECKTLKPKHEATWERFRDLGTMHNNRFEEYRAFVQEEMRWSQYPRQIPCWHIFVTDINRMDTDMKWFVGNSNNAKKRRINVSKVLSVYKFMQKHLYSGTMNGYEDILPDEEFDHKVHQSLAVALSPNGITRFVASSRRQIRP